MCYFNYNYSKKLSCFFLFLTFLLLLPIGNTSSQQKSEDERISNIARGYYQQNIMQQSGSGGDNPEAIQENFFTGAAANDQFGYSVSTAGDVNGDEYSDVIVGAYGNDAGGNSAGRAYIYFGGAIINTTADVTLTGAAAGDNFGYSVSTAGDVNGDGYSDVIVGAYQNDAGGSNAGRAYIYLGGASMNNIADVTLTGAAAFDAFGCSVSKAGDVNGDGYSDVIVGAKWGGDIYNGDGFSELIEGARYGDVISAYGRAYIFFGGVNMNSIADVTMDGQDDFGYCVSSAGDVNGDGYSDVIVSEYYSDVKSLGILAHAYIFLGGIDMDNIPDITLHADHMTYWGIMCSTAGDVNGDGYSDVIVSSYYTDRAYIYFGGESMDNTIDVTLNGELFGDGFANSVSTAGDINGDGYSDVIVGAHGNDAGGSNSGRAYIYFGGTSMDNIADIILTGATTNDEFGLSVASAGDVNGDGCSDVIVGAPWNDAGGSNAGRAYLYTNSLNLFPTNYLQSSLTIGNQYYVDRTYTITNIPIKYSDLKMIKTANADKMKVGLDFHFDVCTNSDVYVAYDRRLTTIPNWISSNYTFTGDTISVSDILMGHFKVWKRTVTPGRITFGDNQGVTNSSMYFVFYKEFNLSFAKRLDIKALIEGFYNGVSMVEDTMSIGLYNAISPYGFYEEIRVRLNQTGNGFANFFYAKNGTNYFVVCKHRNSIETWSKLSQQFIGGSLTYDFTTASTQAYGDNMKLKGGKWTIFSGDVNQDGVVDLSDVGLVDFANLSFITGYVVTDVNGDNVVDLSDVSIVDNNNLNFVAKITPTFTAKPKRIEVNAL